MQYRAMSLLLAPLLLSLSVIGNAAETTKTQESPEDSLVLIVPLQLSTQAMSSGCWAQFYDERNFQGDVLTLLGPTDLQGLDKAAGRQFKRNLDSLVIGPKANLTVFEHQMFKDRSVQFGPSSREGELIKRLGFGGRIQSMKLTCTK